jgi:hypothetical protein
MKACRDLAINDCMMLLGSRNKDVAEAESVLVSAVAVVETWANPSRRANENQINQDLDTKAYCLLASALGDACNRIQTTITCVHSIYCEADGVTAAKLVGPLFIASDGAAHLELPLLRKHAVALRPVPSQRCAAAYTSPEEQCQVLVYQRCQVPALDPT